MKRLLIVFALAALAGFWLFVEGKLPGFTAREHSQKAAVAAPPPAVTVVKAGFADFQQSIQVTGTLVPREEILISPEIEGQRVLDVAVDEGDRVTKGQVLARLESATLEAQVAQNDATLARADAAIAQAESQITQAQARVEEARNALARAIPLRQSGALADATFDQREATSKTADATLVAARDGLKVARADRELAAAQRRELMWRMSRTEIKSPVDGIVSRRTARIGALASAAGDPLFRIISEGQVELDGEVPEALLSRLSAGQSALITVSGLGDVKGRIRLVSPEIDKNSRLGRVRILLDGMAQPRIGSFARASIITATGRGLSLPLAAVLNPPDGARVQVIDGDRVRVRSVVTGLQEGDRVEVKSGLAEGDLVVAKAGTFLRDGERVRPILPQQTVSSQQAPVSEDR